jgi:hypothetical protein
MPLKKTHSLTKIGIGKQKEAQEDDSIEQNEPISYLTLIARGQQAQPAAIEPDEPDQPLNLSSHLIQKGEGSPVYFKHGGLKWLL